MIVTGTIIATYPMGIYAIVVETEDEARQLVRKQVGDGYDYIKIHNILPIELYDAILDEARLNDIGVVGHVPHDISVAHALGQGQETLEHLKGYINDRNLQINTDDWVTPTRSSSAWNVPTLYTHRQYARGAAARDFFASDEARFVPIRFREQWRRTIDDPLHEVYQTELDNRNEVIGRLLPITHRFLAGTDSGSGSEYMVPGFALHTELDMLRTAGLSALETIRSATLYAAQATGREQDFGRVAVGLRASLVLLDENPLQDPDKLRRPAGVMLRGRWFTREVLETEMNWLADLYARQPNAIDADVLVTEIEQLVSEAYVFPTHQLAEIAAALVTLDHHELAGKINALQ
jgi:hypothetical protein